MRQRLNRYTILISRTGKQPTTLFLSSRLLWLGIALAIALPALALGTFAYSYTHRNAILTQRNALLTREAIDILGRLEALEAEINHLQQRAGVVETQPAPSSDRPQGGMLPAEKLLEAANAELPLLSADFRRDVLPAVQETLVREAALPQGLPLQAKTETTSPFGWRADPFDGNPEFHNGIDFKGAYGTPVYVTAAGVVQIAAWSGGYGYHVIVDHGYGYRTLYGHLSKLEAVAGMTVQRGQMIGYLGSTGRSSGPHLHYTVYYDGKAVDPQSYLH